MNDQFNNSAREMKKGLTSIWDVQNRVFDVYRNYMVHWVERSQQSTQEVLDTTQELMSCDGGPKHVMDICGRFMTRNLDRMVSDLGEYARCQGEATKLMQSGMHSAMNQAQDSNQRVAADIQEMAAPRQREKNRHEKDRGA